MIFRTFASQKKNMTLRELINSVDSGQYSDNQLYQKLRDIKPEYGSSKHIQVKVVDGNIAIRNILFTKYKLLIAVFPVDYLKADESGQKFDDLGTWNTRTLDNEIEWNFLILQHIENLPDGIGISQHSALWILRLTP